MNNKKSLAFSSILFTAVVALGLSGCDNNQSQQQSYHPPLQQVQSQQQLYDANGNPVYAPVPAPPVQQSPGVSAGAVAGTVAGAGALAGLAYWAGKNSAENRNNASVNQRPSAPIYQPYNRDDRAKYNYTAPQASVSSRASAPSSNNVFVPKAARNTATVTAPRSGFSFKRR